MALMFIESLPDAAVFTLTAISFGLVWTTRQGGLFHLALGGLMICSIGLFNRLINSGWDTVPAMIAAMIFGAVAGLLVELFVYKSLRRSNSTNGEFLLASFGIMLIFERVASIYLGTMPLYLDFHRVVADRIDVLDGQLTGFQLMSIVVSFVIWLLAVICFVTVIGKRLAAVRQSTLLYDWRIGRSSIFLQFTAALSGALAAITGVLIHLQRPVEINNASMSFMIPAFLVVMGAESLNKNILSTVPSHRRSVYFERFLLLVLYLVIAIALSVLGRAITFSFEPKWKDLILLILSLGVLIIGASGTWRQNENA